ncbi:MAG: ABC transporter ATP-binding protein, partial [Vallitaleaceae bacterium]|nr:ABC transporter ATP-binding protein [Vallitaleaceae bacterium]
GLLAPYFIGLSIDKIPIAQGEEKNVYLVVIFVLMIVYLIDALMNILQSYLMAGLSQRVVLSIRSKLFGKLQALSVSFFDRRPHGELMSRLANDVDNISSTIASSVTQFFVGVIMIVGALLMMLVLSPLLTLASCITLPLMYLLTRSITRKTKVLFRAQQGQLGKLNGMIEENISGIQVVKGFNHEEVSLKEFYQINQELAQTGIKAQIWSGLLMPFMNVINNLGFASVAFVGAYLAIKGMVTVGLIASFISYSRQFTRPLITLANIYNTLQTAVAGAERVFEILDEEEERKDDKEALPMDKVRGNVRFEGVSFGYNEKEVILKNLSFEVKAGQKIALVG